MARKSTGQRGQKPDWCFIAVWREGSRRDTFKSIKWKAFLRIHLFMASWILLCKSWQFLQFSFFTLHTACGKDVSGIRGRISHIQVDTHNWKDVFVLEEAVHMYKAMPVGEIALAQLLFVWDFFSAGPFTGIEYLKAKCSTVWILWINYCVGYAFQCEETAYSRVPGKGWKWLRWIFASSSEFKIYLYVPKKSIKLFDKK